MTKIRVPTKMLLFALATACITVAPAPAAEWKPVRPINLIVPWAAGGSTDQITRITATQLEPLLGQTIVIINQAGASGSLGTKSALDADRDGYTWTSGAAQDWAFSRRGLPTGICSSTWPTFNCSVLTQIHLTRLRRS